MASEPKLSPLACPRCGAAVPLGEGTVARCSYCAIDVPVPPEYIALRDDAKTRVRDKAELDRLYAEASRPPSKLIRGFAAIGRGVQIGALVGGALIIVGTIIGVIIREQDFMTTVISTVLMTPLAIPAFFETLFHLIGSHSYDLVDRLGAFGGLLPGITVWLLVAVPLLISNTCRGALAKIVMLRMRLAAGQPVQPGGPATCRGCGAALDVPPGALGVRCTYCETDNLVTVPGRAAAKDHRETTHMHEAIDHVYAVHQRQLAAARATLRRNLGVSLAGLVVLFGVLYFPAHYFLDGSFTVARTAAGHRGKLYPDDDGNPVIARDSDDTVELGFTWRCHTRKRLCIHFYVALEKGDHVTFASPDRDLDFTLQRHQHLVLSVGVWEPWVDDAKLAERAPYTGWYRVEVSAPFGTEVANTSVRWSASR